ncbi:hypothetical protein AMS68_007753 [Peltaster fructicola]|uniref:Protein MON2 homolog n=1 Tax=Peltaster fructicola TaxID=286661 RepID=A0A6H0Y5J0_9PEZI|nr:hypothetical protein AMS68_007753 [Peltaster fructicola]
MSATLYQNELTSLSTESKRKYPDIRTSTEKSLQELKNLRRRPDFIDPFLKACATSNTKLAISGVNALQRLVISQGLPVSRLNEALQAFNLCAELGLDVQLKVLQALPSLVQNYSEELRGDLLGSALQVCAALQGAKVSTISAVAAATLQQLVASVFSRVSEEDTRARHVTPSATVSGEDGNIELRPAANDAYRVFRDLVFAAEGRSTQFVQLTTLSKEECLELIASCIQAKPQLVNTHEELSRIVRTSVVTLATTALTENLSFTVTVRCIRLLRLLTLLYFTRFQAELEPAISLFTHTMEAESSPLWKKVLVMELLRDIFNEQGLLIKAYIAFDQAKDPKPVVQDILAAFVRLSAEKPATIGLGQQSTAPINPLANRDISAQDLVADPLSGVTGMLNSLGVTETNVQGISSQWSIPKSPCYEQLDKAQPPALPETYMYSLVLDCLHGLSDALAKAVLSSTVHKDDQRPASNTDSSPVVNAAEGLIESCWPAVLATCSTFMNAALDDGYYRALIKAYQRFAQVAGILRLDTPRDALMTTLGKAAVPPQVLNAATADLGRSPTMESSRVFSNPKHLLSIESIVSQASGHSTDKERKSSLEQSRPVLTVRNLLCLRALLNLAISLGPTLQHAFAVVVQVLRQADIVLSAAGPQQSSRASTSSSQSASENPAVVQSFSAEVSAVEAAASRLLESTADYSDEAFMVVLHAFGSILYERPSLPSPSIPEEPGTATIPHPRRQRTFSGLPGAVNPAEAQSRNYQFALPKLGTLAALNIHRFVNGDVLTSGWTYLTDAVVKIAATNASSASARRAATDLLRRLAVECIAEASQQDEVEPGLVQDRSLALLLQVVAGIYEEEGQLTSSDLEVQSHIINAVKTILEQSGETLSAGWDKIAGILSSTFESEHGLATTLGESQVSIDWSSLSNEFVSLRLGRDTFAALQLLIADFFGLLPVATTAAIIELLFRFMSQTEDLNLSLTAITAAWNVSDALFSAREETQELPAIGSDVESAQFEAQLSHLSKTSRSAQWVLLLIKLRQIVAHAKREPAKAAFQTLCSIGKNTGAQLSQQVYAVVLRHILIGVLADDVRSSDWKDRLLTPVLLSGVADSIASQIELVERLPKLGETWSDLNRILDEMLAREHIETATAVYQAFATIFLQIAELSDIWDAATLRTAQLWSARCPTTYPAASGSSQTAYKAYAELGSQILRLRKASLSSQLAYELITQLTACVKHSEASTYSADSQTLSALQAQVLTILKEMPHDVTGIVSHLITAAIEFVTLHHIKGDELSSNSRPSFVALGAVAITWLEELISLHIAATTLSQDNVLERAISCLADVIEEKYHFQVEYKGVWLWRKATSTAVAISRAVLAKAEDYEQATKLRIWRQYIRITNHVDHAEGLSSFHDVQRTFQDEKDDVNASRELSSVLIPRLGSAWIPDGDLQAYTWSLFQASIVHQLERTEMKDIQKNPLRGLTTIRPGRVKRVLPSRREDMSYECFSQMLSLASSIADAPEHERLASAVTPLLILRLAIPIRAYIADQPLRGRMPQPLSELEELLYCFDQIGKLRLSSETVGTAQLQYLYPLLAKAVRVAGDKWCGSEEVLDPLQRLLESFVL